MTPSQVLHTEFLVSVSGIRRKDIKHGAAAVATETPKLHSQVNLTQVGSLLVGDVVGLGSPGRLDHVPVGQGALAGGSLVAGELVEERKQIRGIGAADHGAQPMLQSKVPGDEQGR